MRFKTGQQFLDSPTKAITVMGMSGVGKTRISNHLQNGSWFQYSVDYRIGTRYMDEHIVDNFKREAMKNPFLRDLLKSDSIYIRSNITFANLEPLSTYLGKPGNPAKGGIPFAEYKRRQAEHREAEIRALMDVPEFIRRSKDIYHYQHFICDAGGSLCEVVDPSNPEDLTLKSLSASTLLLYIEGTPEHASLLVERFRKQPKPMYYNPAFLEQKWQEYKKLNAIVTDDNVDPDDFVAWGFEQLLYHRIPLYQQIAKNFGYRVSMQEAAAVSSEDDFLRLVAKTIDRN
jgi:hypothetical protein